MMGCIPLVVRARQTARQHLQLSDIAALTASPISDTKCYTKKSNSADFPYVPVIRAATCRAMFNLQEGLK